jgi:hypothetical protein
MAVTFNGGVVIGWFHARLDILLVTDVYPRSRLTNNYRRLHRESSDQQTHASA